MCYSCRLRIRTNWAATFRLLEVEAGKATYKEFIHSGLVSIINSGKKCVYKHIPPAYIGGKMAYKVLAKSYLGFCKKNNTDDNMIQMKIIHVYSIICYTQLTGAYRGSGSSCRNLKRVVLVSESTAYRTYTVSITYKKMQTLLLKHLLIHTSRVMVLPVRVFTKICMVLSALKKKIKQLKSLYLALLLISIFVGHFQLPLFRLFHAQGQRCKQNTGHILKFSTFCRENWFDDCLKPGLCHDFHSVTTEKTLLPLPCPGLISLWSSLSAYRSVWKYQYTVWNPRDEIDVWASLCLQVCEYDSACWQHPITNRHSVLHYSTLIKLCMWCVGIMRSEPSGGSILSTMTWTCEQRQCNEPAYEHRRLEHSQKKKV